MTQWLTDDIDFSAYEQDTEVRQRVLPASAFTDEVIAYFWDEKSDRGATTPWAKLGDKIRFRPGEVTIWAGINGHGKALSLDTKIPTVSGWKRMGDLAVGDMVFDENGSPCSVTWLSEIWTDRPTYRVEFSDGTVILADENHEWKTDCALSRRSARNAKINGRNNNAPLKKCGSDQRHKMTHPKIRTTREISETVQFIQSGRDISNHSVPVCGALDLPLVELPIDPYVLGVWLGDGDSNGGGLTSADEEIVESMRLAGITVTKRSARYHYGLTGGLTTDLRKAGLLNNKHIPSEYLRSSKEQRLELLKGLMDTDGHITSYGRCEFTSTNERLANGVLELVTSLGIQAKMITGRAKLYGKDCGAKYRVTFTPHIPVFALGRKLKHCKKDVSIRIRNRFIVSCRKVDSVPTRCIEVDSESHLFLASEAMIPTHNSLALGQVLIGFLGQGMGSCIASLEMAPRITLARMCRQYFRVSRPEPELIREFHDSVGKHLCVYDQSGTVTDKKIFAVIRYAAEELGLKHFVLDSLMKCGIAEDDYTGQKMFVDRLCAEAKDTGMHIHLVAHSKKQKDELVPPGKMDVKGAGSMTDQVDNVITWWRNKKKEQADCPDQSEPDAMLICDKQRNGEWEGRAAFWFDRVSQNFVENRDDF